MKYIKYLVVLLAIFLVLPFGVFAEDENNTTSDTETTVSNDDKKVNLYLFRGEGCPHCAEAEEWFDSIKGKYGDYFKVVDYEVWNDEDNAKLMEKVAKLRNEDVSGVPYIIIGDKSWNGFDESYEDEMIDQIKSVYSQDVSKRYDIMNYVNDSSSNSKTKKSSSSDVLALIIILIVVGGAGYGIYYARKSTSK